MTLRTVLLVSAVALAGCGQQPMTEYTAPDGNFKAVFPGDPKVTTNAADGIKLKMYLAESWRRAFMIGWADMPIPPWESESRTKSRLYDGRDGALKAVNGKSNLSTRPITLAGRFPGIEFGGTAEGKYLRARVYLVGARMYQLLVVSRSEAFLTSPEAEEFFDAFQLIDVPAAGLQAPEDTGEPPAPAPEVAAPREIESTGGRFKALYPAPPIKVRRTVGGVEFVGYGAETARGQCTVAYADLPAPADSPGESAEARLDTGRDGFVRALGGAVTESKPVTLAPGHPGREFTATVREKHLRGRVYLVGTRLYQVTALGTREYVDSADTSRFFDSFQLAK